MLIAFNKPYGVVSQFSPLAGHRTLADFELPKNVYPCGRLDRDSEGLLLLTDDGGLQDRLSHPRHGHDRTYWVQVEGLPTEDALRRLGSGPRLSDGPCRPCQARLMADPPTLAERIPPIRFRKNIPTSWLELTLTEGRNRQVRRMTAAVGHPTLRLVRVKQADIVLEGLAPGAWRKVGLMPPR
jgi:23S rRNA pseudouridine2457 synthase